MIELEDRCFLITYTAFCKLATIRNADLKMACLSVTHKLYSDLSCMQTSLSKILFLNTNFYRIETQKFEESNLIVV